MNRNSLRFKIITTTIVTCIIIAILFGLILYPFEKRRRDTRMANVERLLRAVFQQRKEQIANEIFAEQREAVLQSMEEMMKVEGVSAIALYRFNGMLQHTTTAMAFSVLSDEEQSTLNRGFTFTREQGGDRPLAVFSSIVEVYGEQVGYIKIYFDLTELEDEFRLSLVFFSSLLVSVLFIMALLLNVMLARFVILPVNQLRKAMRMVQDGRYGEQVDLDSRDEIGDMAEAFNDMSAQLDMSDKALSDSLRARDRYGARLEETNRQLERLNTDLEGIVAERTMELLDTNRKLMGEIEERKWAESALATEKERLAVTLGSIGDGVITTDMDGRIIMTNKAAETVTGWSESQAMGRLISRVFQAEFDEAAPDQEEPFQAAISDGRPLSSLRPTSMVDRGGVERIVSYSLAPIRDVEQVVIGAVLVFRDVTEQSRYEEEFQKSAKLESLGILAGGIAHDFNNIMTAILGNLSLARQHCGPGGKTHEKLIEAEKATIHAKGLTRQLLTFSKGGAPIKTKTTIGEMLRDTASFALAGSNIRRLFDIDEDLWPLDIDPSQISQVINNLVINAKQAMPEGGDIEIRAYNHILEEGDDYLPVGSGSYVIITVRDEGSGIEEERLSKIFDPYYTTKDQGCGLGLSTSYSIVKNHGGHIDVESKEGIGSRFIVYLPASDTAETEPGPEPYQVEYGHGRILVMDDEEHILDVAREALELLGYQVDTSRDGREAIEKYEKAREKDWAFDAVIMDLTVPGGVGGKEAIRTLRDIDPEVRAIVASGYSQDPVMAEFERFGFRGVLPKPFRLEELSQVLKKVLDGNEKNGAFLGRLIGPQP